jgi:two-component system sensor histidine kinase KdpD
MSLRALTRDYRWGAAATLAGVAVLTAIMAPFRDEIGLLNVGLVLLLSTLLISATWGWRVGVFAAIVANVALNFFFVDPLHKLTVHEANNGVALVVFLFVSLRARVSDSIQVLP